MRSCARSGGTVGHERTIQGISLPVPVRLPGHRGPAPVQAPVPGPGQPAVAVLHLAGGGGPAAAAPRAGDKPDERALPAGGGVPGLVQRHFRGIRAHAAIAGRRRGGPEKRRPRPGGSGGAGSGGGGVGVGGLAGGGGAAGHPEDHHLPELCQVYPGRPGGGVGRGAAGRAGPGRGGGWRGAAGGAVRQQPDFLAPAAGIFPALHRPAWR